MGVEEDVAAAKKDASTASSAFPQALRARHAVAGGRRAKAAALACGVAVVLSAAARAGERWEITTSTFGWALSLSGDSVVGGLPADVEIGFDQIISNLDGAVMGEIAVRHESGLGFFVNGVWGKVTADESVLTALGPVEAEVDTRVSFLDVAGAYRLEPLALSPDLSVAVEPYAGLRYTRIVLKARVNNRRRETTISFTDPLVGVRTVWSYGTNWQAMLQGDIGGFGAGSDVAWNLYALGGYRFGLFGEDDATVFAGYRALSQDYTDGSGRDREAWDVVTHGPIIGLAARF